MMRKMLFSFLILVFIAVPVVSGAHYITGKVENALDGTLANDHTVVLWNPNNGIDDNITDIIGLNGNSGADYTYMIDCELLSVPCKSGDRLNVSVINNGDNYVSINVVEVKATGKGFDIAENLTLNSPPISNLTSPVNYANFSDIIDFNCSVEDYDLNLVNVSLYGNWSGGWHVNETLSISGGNDSAVFSKNLSEGRYVWNCLATDDPGISNFSENNYTVTVDRTTPSISSIFINESSVCGTEDYVRVNCTVTDSLTDINNVIIESIYENGSYNYSAQLLSGDTYYADVLVNETGNWSFNCIANDSAGNLVNLTSEVLIAYSDAADLIVYYSEIVFSNNAPVEDEPVIINATIYNKGCSDANSFLVGFYNGDPDSDGEQINSNRTVSISSLSNITTNVSWDAVIGKNNIFVLADVSDIIIEFNESNNKENNTFDVGAWQEFHGNISIDKLLSDFSIFNMTSWNNESNLSGNVFITDSESGIDWFSLQAIGKNISNDTTTDDFSNMDYLLNMTSFNDSIYEVFTDGGVAKASENFTVSFIDIYDVPIINSTNNSNFITGILWDYSDDVDDGEYSVDDEEDLIFIAKINTDKQGKYGINDYEINIPVRMREYNSTDIDEIYFYYDLL